MNTEYLITTLQAPPCNWVGKQTSSAWYGVSPEKAATVEVTASSVLMQATFAHDMLQETAARNMNYLLVVATVFGGQIAYDWLLRLVKGQESGTMYQGEKGIIKTKLALVIDKAKSTTTLEVREV